MKFIHTADWHLGKKLREHSLIDDQQYILNEFLKLVDNEKPELIIIAGDIYDSRIPPVDAINLFDEVLTKLLLEKKIPVLCIAGNHDDSSRLNFGSKMFDKLNFHMRSKVSSDMEPIIFNDEYGEIYFSPIPYFYPSIVRERFDFPSNNYMTYDDAAKIIIEAARSKIPNNKRSVAIAHLFIKGSVRSESEVQMVGGIDEINAAHFADYNYTALGHLHQPQNRGNNVRYSGSLLKYSFDEEHQNKVIDIVEIDKFGKCKLPDEPYTLTPKRDVRTVTGLLSDILQKEPRSNDYILAKLKDENPYNAGEKLRSALFPNLLGVEIVSEREIRESLKLQQREHLNDAQLFEEFFNDMTGRRMNDEERALFMDCFNELKAQS